MNIAAGERSRRRRGHHRRLAATAISVVLAGAPAFGQWPQWGGPDRNFTADTEGLAPSWPEGGPRRLWHRVLGDGFASIVVDGGLLFTMYRKQGLEEREYTVALDARTGQTVWEHANPAPLDQPVPEWGAGPNATPLVTGDLVCTIGSRSVMHCLNKRTGALAWRRDLAADFGAVTREPGYCCSPIAHDTKIIVPMGRDVRDLREADPSEDELLAGIRERSGGRSLVALERESGRIVWQSQDFEYGFSSPILIEYAGKAQIVLIRSGKLLGVDAENGALLWHFALEDRGDHYMTPLWDGRELVFCCSSGETAGARAVRLGQRNGKIVPEQLWFSRKVSCSMGTPLRIGEYVFGSRGGAAETAVAVNLRTGKRAWIQRGVGEASFVYGDGKVIYLDENGTLGLATFHPEGLTVHSKCQVTERWSLTVPTLVGTTLYVRDRKHIMALDLS